MHVIKNIFVIYIAVRYVIGNQTCIQFYFCECLHLASNNLVRTIEVYQIEFSLRMQRSGTFNFTRYCFAVSY